MDSWHSYPKVYAMGHAALEGLLSDPVLVEEKIDGSQFSFGRFETDDGVVVKCRSKGQQIEPHAPPKMFARAVGYVLEVADQLPLGVTFRAEVLDKPKHNTLAYDRVPRHNLIVFDVNTGHEQYADVPTKRDAAEALDLETVPVLFAGDIEDAEQFLTMLDADSVLGGQKIEGVVVKNYGRFGRDGKVLMGKFVSEKFKEVHGKEWKQRNPGGKSIVEQLGQKYRTPARWQKAVQHLVEAGALEHSPRDIGLLMKAVAPDIEAECKDEILDSLWRWAWPHIRRDAVRGLPEWYKEQLLARQFEE